MSKAQTQKQKIAELLLNGGFSAYDAIYTHGITRAATYVHELRQEGWQIEMERKAGETARYWLSADPPGIDRSAQATIWNEV